MSVTALTTDNLETTLESNDIVIIDFWASWCGPCQAFKPIFEEAAGRHQDVKFVSCNTEEQTELAGMFQIRSIPTLVVFREKVAVFAQPGMLPAESLDELVTKVKALDMAEVHAAVAEQQKATATA